MKVTAKSTLLWSFAFALFLFLVSSCGGSEKKNTTGNDSLPSGDTLQAAISRLTDLIDKNPNDYQNYYERSLLYYQSGNTFQAVQDVEASLRLFDKFPDGYHLRGFYAYVQNEDSLALTYFQKAALMGSENPETYYHMGQIYFFKHNYSEAEKYYNTAISLDSLQPIYPFAKGYMYEAQKKYDKAIEYYEEARKVDPGFIKALWRLHIMYKEVKHDMARAIAYNDMILQVDSMHPIGTFNRGLFYMESALSITDTAESEEFQILLRQAVGQFSRTLAADGRFKNASFNRGYCFLLMGRFDEALADLQAAIELDPYNDKAFFLAGSILESRGRVEEALGSYEQALSLNPKLKEAAEAVKELRPKVGAQR